MSLLTSAVVDGEFLKNSKIVKVNSTWEKELYFEEVLRNSMHEPIRSGEGSK